jgi:pimeloyl-ACP methyl ester carboxylesterase
MKHKISFQVLAIVTIMLPASLNCQTVGGWKASAETVEKLTKSRPEFNYYEEKVPSFELPSLLTANNGKIIATRSEWIKIRRPELLELFTDNVFGRAPGTHYKLDFKVVNEDPKAVNGIATLKQVDVIITSEAKSLVIHLILFIPNNVPKPVPAFLLINLGSKNIDPLRKEKGESWPVEEIVARGYAAAAFSNADVDPDNFDDFKNGIHLVLDRGIRSDDAWGTLAAWAWGASRCLDYLITDKDIAKNKVAVVGHSRGGKTALWAGATDQRFAMVVANESGAGGAAIARRRLGETVARLNSSFPHWYCTNYRKYNNREDSLPVDAHELLALIAPRNLYIDAASEDLWGDPKGCYLALLNALPAYNVMGIKSELPKEVPPLNKQVISGKVAFHIRDGEHNLKLTDWNFFMDFADEALK